MGEVFTHKLELALAHTALIATGATAIDIVEHDEVHIALVEGIDRRAEGGAVSGGLAPEHAVGVAVVIAHHGIGARGQLGYHALQVGIEREVVVDQVAKEEIDIGAVLGHEFGQDGAWMSPMALSLKRWLTGLTARAKSWREPATAG